MAKDNRPATYRAPRADHCAARNPDATCHCGIGADLHVVTDLDLIVQLDTIPDHRVAQCAPVDRRAGANFNIVADQHAPDLGNLDPGAVGLARKTEAVGTDYSAGMNQAVLAEVRAGIQRDIAREPRAGADLDPLADTAVGADYGMCADPGPRPDPYMCADAGIR